MTRRLSFLCGALAALAAALVLPPDALLPGASADVTCSTVPMTCSAGTSGPTGSGTSGAIAKWTGASTLGDSLLSESGGNVTLGSGQLILPAGSVGTPGVKFTNTGLYEAFNSPNYYLGVVANTGSTEPQLGLYRSKLALGSNSTITWQSSSSLQTGSVDVTLARDAAGALAQRNSTNAQTFNIYETYTDGSNYSRMSIKSTGTQFQIVGQHSGTGLARDLLLAGDGSTYVGATAGSYLWFFENGTGHFKANVDNTYDIGASGASRPRNGYFSGSLVPGGDIILGAGGSYIRSSTSGVILLGNASLNDFSRLQFGGTTSSFPALKRNGAGIDFRLADDSAYTYALQSGIYGGLYETGGSTAITITTAGTYYQWVNSTSGTCTNMTCSTATDDVTATVAGKYRVNVEASFTSSINNEIITARVYNEGVGQTNCTAAKKLATAANLNDISISCIVTMAVNDSLDLRFTSSSSSSSVTPQEVNLNAAYLGN